MNTHEVKIMKIGKLLILCCATLGTFGCSKSSTIKKYSNVVKATKFSTYLEEAMEANNLLSDDETYYSFVAKANSYSVSKSSLNVAGKAKSTTKGKAVSTEVIKYDATNNRYYDKGKTRYVETGTKTKNLDITKTEKQIQSTGKNVYTIDLLNKSYSSNKSSDAQETIGTTAYYAFSNIASSLSSVLSSSDVTFYADKNNTLFTAVIELETDSDDYSVLNAEDDDYLMSTQKIIYQIEISSKKISAVINMETKTETNDLLIETKNNSKIVIETKRVKVKERNISNFKLSDSDPSDSINY